MAKMLLLITSEEGEKIRMQLRRGQKMNAPNVAASVN